MSTTRLSRHALMGLGVMAMFAAPAMAQPVLTLEGSCPGPLRAEVTGAPPDPRLNVWLLFASEPGSVAIPGHVCQGLRLGLGRRNLRVAATGHADENGIVVFEGSAGPLACGGFLQVLAWGNCEVSNVVQIE